MRKLLFVLFILFSIKFNLNAQINNHTFSLIGSINIDSGKILLIGIGDSTYYPQNQGMFETSISHGKFLFKGEILYPYAFRLQVLNDSNRLLYVSSLFFIDSGTQRITCNVHIVRENPEILNVTSVEKKERYEKAYDQINKTFSTFYREKDSVYDKYNNNIPPELSASYSKEYRNLEYKRNLVLLDYTKKHPDSFVALWELVYKLDSGSRPIYDSIYSQFSNKLKRTVTGKRLYNRLKFASVVNVGNPFPHLLLKNLKNETTRILVNENKKYTLVDFWFSHCFPCISQFAELKAIFKKYNRNKLNIISISVDDSANITNWKKAINQYRLPWEQYLDLNGKEAKRLSIFEFPTNFLLDKSGQIIATDIEPAELNQLLKEDK